MRMETSFSKTDKTFDSGYRGNEKTFDSGFVDVNEVVVTIQHKAGDHIKITEDGAISVLTADKVEYDNTHPITSAAVAVEVGNIDILLKTI